MAQSVKIAGALFPDVPYIQVPDQDDVYHGFYDVSDTTAAASDVASGKYFYTAAGVKTAGTASGGGGSGLEYESGVYIPTSDVARPTINFTNTHTKRPIAILIQDMGGSGDLAPSSSNLVFALSNWYEFSGIEIYGTATVARYAYVSYFYKGTSGVSTSGVAISRLTGTNSAAFDYWATNTGFKPGSNSDSRYWRANRTYKWMAVWAPTS